MADPKWRGSLEEAPVFLARELLGADVVFDDTRHPVIQFKDGRQSDWNPLGSLDDCRPLKVEMRIRGWRLAICNDYDQNETHTFWLWTHYSGRFVKVETLCDSEPEAIVRAGVAACDGEITDD